MPQDEIHDKGVPDSVTTIFQAPYALGPIMLAVVESQEKADGIDDLFERPPTSDASYLTPASLLEQFKPAKVRGAEAEGGREGARQAKCVRRIRPVPHASRGRATRATLWRWPTGGAAMRWLRTRVATPRACAPP